MYLKPAIGSAGMAAGLMFVAGILLAATPVVSHASEKSAPVTATRA